MKFKTTIYFLLLLCDNLFSQTFPIECLNTPMVIYSNLQDVSTLNYLRIDSTAGTAYFDAFSEPSGFKVNGIGYRLQDKMVYGCQSNRLIRIDARGRPEELTQMSLGSFAGDVTPDGKYLVLVGVADKSLLFVDLASGNYEEKTLALSAPFFPLDIAFNPVTGVLYGFDAGLKRLATIDLQTGFVDLNNYPVVDIETGLAALFFDAFGNLWGLGGPSLYQISTRTGLIMNKIPVEIESGGRLDGCSCPGSFNFQLSTWPDTVSHCGIVDLIYIISNRTGAAQTDLTLENWLPTGVLIDKIIKNPFGGQVDIGANSGHLKISQMKVNEGVDSLVVRVVLDNLPSGIVRTQAQLFNIRISSDSLLNLLSDDPATHQKLDSTSFVVTDLEKIAHNERIFICEGQSVELKNPKTVAEYYTWSTGQTTPSIQVDEPGVYVLTLEDRCTAFVEDSFFVFDGQVYLDLGPDIELIAGDTIRPNPTVNGLGNLVLTKWSNQPDIPNMDCNSCLHPLIFPLEKSIFTLNIKNEHGCSANDDLGISVKYPVYVPNVFNPNADDDNAWFFIQSKNPYRVRFLQIFNRWGELVFEEKNFLTNDLSKAWNGSFRNKKLPSGVFVWQAEMELENGRVVKFAGDVSIVR